MRVLEKKYSRDKKYCNPGSQYAEEHIIKIDDQGHKTLVKSGETTNIYLKIQAHADSCDIEKILARCEIEGYEILDQRNVLEGDVTLAPKSMLEAAQKLQEAENKFNKLPIEVRREFNFNFNEYIAEASSDLGAWAKKMGFITELPKDDSGLDPTPIVESEGGEE